MLAVSLGAAAARFAATRRPSALPRFFSERATFATDGKSESYY
jgi:hypothetical protein